MREQDDELAALAGSVLSRESDALAALVGCIIAALALGLVLSMVYCFRTRHTRSFATTLALLPAIVCVVIAMVNGNIGAGVAVAGAFSLVRFRSVPGRIRAGAGRRPRGRERQGRRRRFRRPRARRSSASPGG